MGRDKKRGTRSRSNGRNLVMTKFWVLEILGTWPGLKLRPYLNVKIEIELKSAKVSRYHQLHKYLGRLGRISPLPSN